MAWQEGTGAGTDFVQWARAGALAYGVDLTAEGIAHTHRRLEHEGLEAVELCQSDAENLDYPDNMFDALSDLQGQSVEKRLKA